MITRIRLIDGGVDEYGDPVESTEDVIELPGASAAPRTSGDVDGRGRDGVVVGLTVYVPDPSADVVRTDLIGYRGERWLIEGEVGVWESPYGPQVDGLEIALKRGEG